MAIQSYADLRAYMDGILKANNEMVDTQNAPHGAFWDDLSYNDFVTGSVPNVKDPNTGKPIPILVKGNAAESNFILALQGKGPLFDPQLGAFGRMPADGPPYFTDTQIQPIIDWINAGCPNS